MLQYLFCVILLLSKLAAMVTASPLRRAGTYTNPILDGNYADPWVLKWNDTYYLTPSMPDGTVSVFVSKNVDHFNSSAPNLLWQPPKGSGGCWAPELHRLDDQWYIYCATLDGTSDEDRRMHVLQGTDPNDPTKPFKLLGVISTPDRNFAIDGTVLHDYNGANYFIWSGHESKETQTVQNLYIAKMANATTLIGERTLIHTPYLANGSRNEWQWSPSNASFGINEGPEILQNSNQTFLIYSASASWDNTYSLAIMGLPSPNLDPLDPKSWWAKDDAPIFQQGSQTAGTGHASFTTDANNASYIVFHGWPKSGPPGWGSRIVYTQNFTFGDDEKALFGEPVAKGLELPAPAGFA